MSGILRKWVSKNKRRFQGHGYDLDLQYITNRIVAMGYPSCGKEARYRNPLVDVQRFITQFHDGHYRIYNLCSEREYDPSAFSNHVVRFPFPDHQPPPVQMMYDFCNDAQQFLDADERNVIFVHCKAGKGRTGVMICAYLLYTGAITDPSICMAFYGMKRTTDGEGVTIPSQRRYIDYFSSVLAWPLFRQAQQPGSSTTGPSLEPNIAALDELQIITPMSNRKLAVRVSMRDASDVVVEVFSPDACLYELIGKSKLKVKVNNKVFFRGDIKIEVLLVKNKTKKKYKTLFSLWQHSSFLPQDGLVRLHGKVGLDKVKSGVKKDAILVEMLCDIRSETDVRKTNLEIVGVSSMPSVLVRANRRVESIGGRAQAALHGIHDDTEESPAMIQLQEELIAVRERSDTVISEQAEKIRDLERRLTEQSEEIKALIGAGGVATEKNHSSGGNDVDAYASGRDAGDTTTSREGDVHRNGDDVDDVEPEEIEVTLNEISGVDEDNVIVVEGLRTDANNGAGANDDDDELPVNMNEPNSAQKSPLTAVEGGSPDPTSGSPALWDSLRRMHMVMSTLKKEQEKNADLNKQINSLMAKMA